MGVGRVHSFKCIVYADQGDAKSVESRYLVYVKKNSPAEDFSMALQTNPFTNTAKSNCNHSIIFKQMY